MRPSPNTFRAELIVIPLWSSGELGEIVTLSMKLIEIGIRNSLIDWAIVIIIQLKQI